MGGRRRSRGRGTSRRTFLAGSCIAVGSGLLLKDADAFSQTMATRGASIGVASDEDALLGVDVEPVIAVGSHDAPLVTITNKAAPQLEVSVELLDATSEEYVTPAGVSLASGQSTQFSAYVDPNRDVGNDGVSFSVTATDSESITIDLERHTIAPAFDWAIIDESYDGNAQFTVQYQTSNLPSFDRVEIDVRNCGTSFDGSEDDCGEVVHSFTEMDPEGVVSYPPNGPDWDGEGQTYMFTFSVFDHDLGLFIEETTTRVADSDSNHDDGDFGSDDDPRLAWFTIEDQSSGQHGTNLTVEYQIDENEESDNFGWVEIEFDTDDDPGGYWADETLTSEGLSDEVTHTNGGTHGSTYEITLRVKNPNGITLHSESVSIVSGSHETIEWPP